MKDLKKVSRVRMSTPDAAINAPVRADLLGSNDGEFWFRIASNPEREKAKPAAKEFARMTQRVYVGNYHTYTNWNQVADLGMNRSPMDSSTPNELAWSLDKDADRAKKAHGVLWTGKLVQQRPGSVRIAVSGYVTGLALNGIVEMPIKRNKQSVDLWLLPGANHLPIFAACTAGTRGVEATIARSNLTSNRVSLIPFSAADFELSKAPAAKPVACLLYTSPSPRDLSTSRMPSSA